MANSCFDPGAGESNHHMAFDMLADPFRRRLLSAGILTIGGGALAAGVGCAVRMFNPAVRVVGVQTESYPALAQSFHAGRPVWVASRPTICDGVAVPFTTDQLYPLLRETVDRVAVVSEERVRTAIRSLAEQTRLVAEGAGALALAAALDTPLEDRGLSVCLVTGGNIPSKLLDELLARPADGERGAPNTP